MMSIDLPDKVTEALDCAAKEDGIAISSLVERILETWLIENGYTPDPRVSDGN
jgi:hypothetical protein